MKKISPLILICALLVSCSGTKHDLPEWAFNPYIKNGVAAVGLAYPNKKNEYYDPQKLDTTSPNLEFSF